jgi:hypothetical protein
MDADLDRIGVIELLVVILCGGAGRVFADRVAHHLRGSALWVSLSVLPLFLLISRGDWSDYRWVALVLLLGWHSGLALNLSRRSLIEEGEPSLAS